jgi:NADH-quinone oxidoreductase subunit I
MNKKIFHWHKLFFIIKSFFGVIFFKRLIITAKYAITKKNTINYPEETTPKSSRFRGLHALRRYDNGQERCIGCKLCEAVCPAVAINIDSVVDPGNNIRKVNKYEIDLFKCVYCGMCEESCPVDAIVQTNIDDYHFMQRGEQILTKQKLLAIGDQYESSIVESKEEDTAFC